MRKSAATLFGLCRLALGLTRSGRLRALLRAFTFHVADMATRAIGEKGGAVCENRPCKRLSAS